MKAAIQMDSLEGININGDSSFAILLKGQERGYEQFYYDVRDLTWHDGRLTTRAFPVRVQRIAGDHYKLGDPMTIDLGSDIDVVLMRQDPPFDMNYITATHLLEMLPASTMVVNNPSEVRNAPEKLLVTLFPDLMPPTLISRDLDTIRAFRDTHQDIIIKPLFGNGGGFLLSVSVVWLCL